MATATNNGHRTHGHVAIEDGDNPLHRLTPEQIEAIGREFDALHEEVKADLGDRDATYIRSGHRVDRRGVAPLPQLHPSHVHEHPR